MKYDGTPIPYSEVTFEIVLGDSTARATCTAFGWTQSSWEPRAWNFRRADWSFNQRAGLDWAIGQVWRVANDLDRYTPDPETPDFLAWADAQRARFEEHLVDCSRLVGDPRVSCLVDPVEGPVGTVYLIEARKTASVKIGFTDKPIDQRLRQLQTGSPSKLVLKSSFPGSRNDERTLHRRLASHRVRGEWFRHEAHVVEVFVRAAVHRRSRARCPDSPTTDSDV